MQRAFHRRIVAINFDKNPVGLAKIVLSSRAVCRETQTDANGGSVMVDDRVKDALYPPYGLAIDGTLLAEIAR